MTNNKQDERLVHVEEVVRTRLPTALGEFALVLFSNNRDDKDHLALVMGEVAGQEQVLTRVHSECLTGDLLGSQRCDCGEQLQQALAQIAAEGQGVLLYLRQEGRGIGLLEKLRAYNLQDQGYDTVDANLILGHQADSRDYSVCAAMLGCLELKSIRLLTNNPSKINRLISLGVDVVDRVPLTPTVNENNARYLHTKVERMNHLLNLPELKDEPDAADVNTD